MRNADFGILNWKGSQVSVFAAKWAESGDIPFLEVQKDMRIVTVLFWQEDGDLEDRVNADKFQVPDNQITPELNCLV